MLKQGCPSIKNRDFNWPWTESNSIARMPCPNGAKGHAEWLCDKNGQWNKNGVDMSRCESFWSKKSFLK